MANLDCKDAIKANLAILKEHEAEFASGKMTDELTSQVKDMSATIESQ